MTTDVTMENVSAFWEEVRVPKHCGFLKIYKQLSFFLFILLSFYLIKCKI